MPLDAAELAADADVDERPVGENMQQVTRRAQAQDAADRYVSMSVHHGATTTLTTPSAYNTLLLLRVL